MAAYPQSVAYTRTFKMIDSTDHFSKKTGLTCTVNLSKAGAAFGTAGGAVTEIANGWYKVALNTTDTNTLGDLSFYITATGADDTDFVDQVIDPVRGLGSPSAIPNVAPGAAGGLFIAGSNAATTVASWTISGVCVFTGNVSMAAGLTITQSTSNGNGISVTGNGNGAGILLVGGGGANAHGLSCMGGGANGSGIRALSSGGGAAGISGGSSGNGFGLYFAGSGTGSGAFFGAGDTGAGGIQIQGGATSGAGIYIATTVGDGITILPTAGHGINIQANGTSKHGILSTGGTAGTSDGIKAVAGTGGVDLRANITGSLNGDVTALSATTTNAIADSLLDRADAIETGITPRLSMRYGTAALAGVLSGAATATVTIKGANVATTRISATVDASGNRSAVTLS